MARRSNKSIAEILTPPIPTQGSSKNGDDLLEMKISMASEGFGMTKFCELILKDRNRLYKKKFIDSFRLYHSNEKRGKSKTQLQKINYADYI